MNSVRHQILLNHSIYILMKKEDFHLKSWINVMLWYPVIKLSILLSENVCSKYSMNLKCMAHLMHNDNRGSFEE